MVNPKSRNQNGPYNAISHELLACFPLSCFDPVVNQWHLSPFSSVNYVCACSSSMFDVWVWSAWKLASALYVKVKAWWLRASTVTKQQQSKGMEAVAWLELKCEANPQQHCIEVKQRCRSKHRSAATSNNKASKCRSMSLLSSLMSDN